MLRLTSPGWEMWCRKARFFSQVWQESKKKDHRPQSFFSLMFAGSLKWTLCFDIGGSGLCKSLCKKEIESESFHLGTLCSNWLGPNLNSAKCQKVVDWPKLISRVKLDYLIIFHHLFPKGWGAGGGWNDSWQCESTPLRYTIGTRYSQVSFFL